MKKSLKALTAALLSVLLTGGLVTALAAGPESKGIEVQGYVASTTPTPTSAPPYYPPAPTSKPTQAPTPTTLPTSAPTTAPTSPETPTLAPTAVPDKPSGGETKPPLPPGPADPGDTLAPKDDGGYIEVDKDGVPQGEWHWDPDEGWVYEKYPDKADPAKTGDTRPLLRYVIIAVSTLPAIALLLLTRKRRGDK